MFFNVVLLGTVKETSTVLFELIPFKFTTALNVLAEKGLMEKTTTIGGMNLPLALTSVLMKDTLQGDSFVQAVLSEATTALQEFKVVEDDEDDI